MNGDPDASLEERVKEIAIDVEMIEVRPDAGGAELVFDSSQHCLLRDERYDVRRHLRRKVRQMRGRIQNAAIKDLIYRAGYEGLPEDADELVESYLAVHGPPKVGWSERAFQLALGKSPMWCTCPLCAAMLPRRPSPQ